MNKMYEIIIICKKCHNRVYVNNKTGGTCEQCGAKHNIRDGWYEDTFLETCFKNNDK